MKQICRHDVTHIGHLYVYVDDRDEHISEAML
jgi:hypothetical protein